MDTIRDPSGENVVELISGMSFAEWFTDGITSHLSVLLY